jgi:hypothetical protein
VGVREALGAYFLNSPRIHDKAVGVLAGQGRAKVELSEAVAAFQ